MSLDKQSPIKFRYLLTYISIIFFKIIIYGFKTIILIFGISVQNVFKLFSSYKMSLEFLESGLFIFPRLFLIDYRNLTHTAVTAVTASRSDVLQ